MNDQAFTFQTLHPDTIMDALFEQGIRVDSGLTPLNSYENRVYQFQDEDRQRFVVKFYRPERWSAEQIQEEHQFAHDLLDDDVPVAAPLKFNNQTLLTHEGFYYAVFPSLGGASLKRIISIRWSGLPAILGAYTRRDAKKPLLPARLSEFRNTFLNRGEYSKRLP
ncbi:aminoglycoside phosphotransferase [Enterobacter asburiae]|uniref:Aminoglycoside phosphotransferase n=1 Tax=Enterobacter asburiae TaxID=61645 RepID=A0A376FE94_ENTAS|nr:aminoglycoside phosphotransferase [Enterobacter asburiae]